MLYDCFGISNHFGGVGGGHYTAFAKNPMSGKWYNFDDSSVSPAGQISRHGYDTMVSSSAYNLFYRLRSEETMDSCDLDQLV